MNKIGKLSFNRSNIINELLLYSGQYALFYIIMNFSKDGIFYFNDTGHVVLILILFIQTIFLANWGYTFVRRFLGSLIAPFFYTIVEFNIDLIFLTNSAHVMFWIFSFITGLLQAIQQKQKISLRLKKLMDFINNLVNITIFIFLYYYFDLYLSLTEQVENGIIDEFEYIKMLDITSFFTNISIFLEDKAHIFIILAGLFLSLSIGIGRIKVIQLTENIKNMFGKYVDEGIRDSILVDGSGTSKKLKLVVMFIDIRNFTTISENSTPEGITKMLNLYFSAIANEIKLNNGIIDKYMGDGLMAVFGLDLNSEGCNFAHNCAVNILHKIPGIVKDLERNELPLLEKIGIGLHFGDVIAGDIGSSDRVNYTFIGDTVNISSRLESSCKVLDSDYVISSEFYENLNIKNKNSFSKAQDKITVKGKKEPLTVYTFNR